MARILIDQDEEQAGIAEFQAEVYFTFHKCKAGLGNPADWDFIGGLLGCRPDPIFVRAGADVDTGESLPF